MIICNPNIPVEYFRETLGEAKEKYTYYHVINCTSLMPPERMYQASALKDYKLIKAGSREQAATDMSNRKRFGLF